LSALSRDTEQDAREDYLNESVEEGTAGARKEIAAKAIASDA
jgi:hypothetical protein